MSRSFVGVFLGLVVGVGTAGSAACSSSSATSTSPEAATACPATIADTVGSACNTERAVCSPTFPCAIATVTIFCTCTQGTFQCVDGNNMPFTAGETPTCGDAGTLGSCPTTESQAAIGKCTQAQSGQQCAYAPECTGGTLAFDRCTCEPVPTGGGFAWDCENSCNSGIVPEAGVDAQPDVQTPVDSGSSSDAPTDVTSQ